MTLSRREQIMLSVLLIIGILAAGYYWVFQPMWNQHLDLQMQRQELQSEYDAIMAEIGQIDNLKTQASELSAAIAERTKKYYPSIIQEKLLLTMNDLADRSDIITTDESYSLEASFDYPDWQSGSGDEQGQPVDSLANLASRYQTMESGQSATPADQEEAALPELTDEEQALALSAVDSISSMSMNVRFPATYEQAMSWLSSVEGLNRSILIRSIDLTGSDANTSDGLPTENPAEETAETPDNNARLLDCSFDLQFVALPKLIDQDADYINWPLNRAYGKMDPFADGS